MPGYWWQCENCRRKYDFEHLTNSSGIGPFIRDELAPSEWDQILLAGECPECGKTVRITYEFPRRAGGETVHVLHIVGLPFDKEGKYLHMMWETYFEDGSDEPLFDFKYIWGRNIHGLNKPAVFTQEMLRRLFSLYAEKVGKAAFP